MISCRVNAEKVMPISLRQIRYFVAVADCGKISAAAANLSVSPSAISAAVSALEQELGAPLFERRHGGVDLTSEGHQFLRRAQNILTAVSEAMRGFRRSGRTLGGEVRVGVTYTVAGYFLPDLLARFERSFPKVQIKLQERQREDIEQRLVDGRLDLAVMLVSNLHNRTEIDSRVLVRSQRRLWLSNDHPLLTSKTVSLKAVSRESYIMLSVDEADRTAMRYWRQTPFRPNVIFTTSSVEAVRSMVANGMGVTILSDMVYRPWSLEGEHVEVREIGDPVPTMDAGLAWGRGLELSASAVAFYEFLCQVFPNPAVPAV